MPPVRRATGPGRVNLIGDHTDYNLGLALPMAIGLGVSVTFTPTDRPHLTVTSAAFGATVEVPLDLSADPETMATLEPAWARLVGAVATLARPASGGTVDIATTLPIGSGLASSAATAVALADVFGVTGPPEVIARLCQEAEHRTGVPVGLMDPLVCAGGRRGHALLIDFSTLATEHIGIPQGVDIVVVDSGQRRTLRTSEYAARVMECEAAAAVIGPLGLADEHDIVGLRDSHLRRRARHVVSECRRVRQCAIALSGDDPSAAGAAMFESHRSLALDFDVSTPALDSLVDELIGRPGVFGARMTGAGFGGCVVALCRPGAIDPQRLSTPAWRVEACDGTASLPEG